MPGSGSSSGSPGCSRSPGATSMSSSCSTVASRWASRVGIGSPAPVARSGGSPEGRGSPAWGSRRPSRFQPVTPLDRRGTAGEGAGHARPALGDRRCGPGAAAGPVHGVPLQPGPLHGGARAAGCWPAAWRSGHDPARRAAGVAAAEAGPSATSAADPRADGNPAFLAEEQRQGLVTVQEEAQRVLIRLAPATCSRPGVPSIASSVRPLLDKNGQALRTGRATSW